MKVIEFLATAFTVIGFYCISAHIFAAGFAISLAANVLWLAWAYDTKAFGIGVVNALLLFSSVNGLMGSL